VDCLIEVGAVSHIWVHYPTGRPLPGSSPAGRDLSARSERVSRRQHAVPLQPDISQVDPELTDRLGYCYDRRVVRPHATAAELIADPAIAEQERQEQDQCERAGNRGGGPHPLRPEHLVRRDGASAQGEPVHQQLHSALSVRWRQASSPAQGGQPVQGRPEDLGEQPGMDTLSGDLGEALE
jgi:hypothetical protein